eukprot:1159398-Pelagomonas_calceolata.AAC.30
MPLIHASCCRNTILATTSNCKDTVGKTNLTKECMRSATKNKSLPPRGHFGHRTVTVSKLKLVQTGIVLDEFPVSKFRAHFAKHQQGHQVNDHTDIHTHAHADTRDCALQIPAYLFLALLLQCCNGICHHKAQHDTQMKAQASLGAPAPCTNFPAAAGAPAPAPHCLVSNDAACTFGAALHGEASAGYARGRGAAGGGAGGLHSTAGVWIGCGLRLEPALAFTSMTSDKGDGPLRVHDKLTHFYPGVGQGRLTMLGCM